MKKELTPLQMALGVLAAFGLIAIIGFALINRQSGPPPMSAADANLPGVVNKKIVWIPPASQVGPPPGAPAQPVPAP